MLNKLTESFNKELKTTNGFLEETRKIANKMISFQIAINNENYKKEANVTNEAVELSDASIVLYQINETNVSFEMDVTLKLKELAHENEKDEEYDICLFDFFEEDYFNPLIEKVKTAVESVGFELKDFKCSILNSAYSMKASINKK